jgi:anaerobic selenocysteine-containing dehydrogenase
VYEEEDLYRGQERRDVVLMSAADAERLGLARDTRVRVENSVGAMEVLVRIAPLPLGKHGDVLPGGERADPARDRSSIGDPGLQVDDGPRGAVSIASSDRPPG